MSLMGILSGRVFGKTGAVWVCGALFLCAAGVVRMEMAEEIWRQQSQYIVGSEGTFCGIVAEEPLVYKGEDGAQSSGSGSGGDALVEPLFPF